MTMMMMIDDICGGCFVERKLGTSGDRRKRSAYIRKRRGEDRGVRFVVGRDHDTWNSRYVTLINLHYS